MNNDYEDLEVWQKAKNLAVNIYQLTKTFPKEDLDGITSQIRRASLYIPSAIAEGASRGSDKEFIRFIMTSFGALAATRTQLIMAKDIGILSQEQFDGIDNELQQLGKMLKTQERNIKNKHLQ